MEILIFSDISKKYSIIVFNCNKTVAHNISKFIENLVF